jgi:dolichol-phosphate mannosyltransferase
MASPIDLSVVVPCFDEEASLPALLARLGPVCRAVAGDSHEIVLVNDGSRDRTWAVMTALARTDPALVCVNLSRNHGHQLALTAGLTLCRGGRILVIDADLQDPPELLPAMMARIDAGCDVVYGQRATRAGETVFKTVTAALFYRLLRRIVDVDIPLDAGDFRLMTRRALDVLLAMPEQHRFIRGMVSWIGFRQEPIRYDRDVRFAGTTKYPLAKMLRFAMDAVTGFSIRPLRVATWLGFATIVAALVAGLYVVAQWASGAVVPGWTSVMIVSLILGSMQLLVAGLLGEYLGRLYMEAKRRPLFVIDAVVRGEVAAVRGPVEVAAE